MNVQKNSKTTQKHPKMPKKLYYFTWKTAMCSKGSKVHIYTFSPQKNAKNWSYLRIILKKCNHQKTEICVCHIKIWLKSGNDENMKRSCTAIFSTEGTQKLKIHQAINDFCKKTISNKWNFSAMTLTEEFYQKDLENYDLDIIDKLTKSIELSRDSHLSAFQFLRRKTSRDCLT